MTINTRPFASSAKGSVMSPETSPSEPNDSIFPSTIRSIPFCVATQIIPARSSNIARTRSWWKPASSLTAILSLPRCRTTPRSSVPIQKSPRLLIKIAFTGSWLLSKEEPNRNGAKRRPSKLAIPSDVPTSRRRFFAWMIVRTLLCGRPSSTCHSCF